MPEIQPCTIEIIDEGSLLAGMSPAVNYQHIQRLVDDALAHDRARKPTDEIHDFQLTVMFIDQAESSALHAQHFDDANSTDVMSFPDHSYDPQTECVHLGDLAICVAVAETAGAQRGLSTADELLLYVIHGLLHILGYDDHADDERRVMWAEQVRLMALVDVPIADN